LALSLVAVFVGHVVWFRFGWEDLPLRCLDHDEWSGWQELSGELQPQAANRLESTLRALYGKSAVKRAGAGRVQVRPAVIYFGDDGRLADLTTLLTYRFASARGSIAPQAEWVSDCRLAEHELMACGQARSCWDPWEPHIYGLVDQESWPWLARSLGVQIPSVSGIDQLSWLAPPIPTAGLPRLENQVVPDEIACGLTFHDRVWFYSMVLVGLVGSLGQSLGLL
jgi:hypothetical protein